MNNLCVAVNNKSREGYVYERICLLHRGVVQHQGFKAQRVCQVWHHTGVR